MSIKSPISKLNIRFSLSGMYLMGMSLPEIENTTGVHRSTVRRRLITSGVEMRTRIDGVMIAADNGKLGGGTRGKTRVFSESWKKNIRQARIEWGIKNAKGLSLKPSGYFEYTRGENKGRLVHVVIMEKRLGRRLREDECVHHIDGNKQNNDDSNLALVTIKGHSRLHRREEALSWIERERNKDGTWR